jgi:hypothetical protein
MGFDSDPARRVRIRPRSLRASCEQSQAIGASLVRGIGRMPSVRAAGGFGLTSGLPAVINNE